MSIFLQDLRQVVRSLAQARGLTLIVLTILALGFGLNAAMFSAAYHLLLRPLPYAQPERLLQVFETRPDGSPAGVALANLLDWRQQATRVTGLAAYRKRSFGLKAGANADVAVVQVGLVTSDFLPVLAVQPAQGRVFSEQEEETEATVVVLSDATWRLHLQGAAAIDHQVLLNERPFTVVGVLPADFEYKIDGQALDAYIPLSRTDYGHSRSVRTLKAFARLTAGASLDEARQELATLAARSARDFPDTNAQHGADAKSLHQALTGSNQRPLALLVGAGLLLLMIASTSVANLLVTRLVSRLRQVAVRLALGANAWQLGRLFFLEAAVLCLAGAALGLLLAQTFLSLLPRVLPLLGGSGSAPRLDSLSPDAVTALAVGLLALAATIIFGMLPTLLARRPDLVQLLKAGGAPHSLRHRLRSGLVVLQIALSVLLLLASGLLLRSFFELLTSDPGFNTAQVHYFGLGLPEQRYDSEEKIIAFHRQLQTRLSEQPGIAAAGAVVRLPLVGGGFRAGFYDAGVADAPVHGTGINLVTPQYFAALGASVVAGRDFTWDDRLDTPRVLLVNQAFRRAFLDASAGTLPDAGPTAGPATALGRSLALSWASPSHPKGSVWQIVGVVSDMNERSLEDQAEPMVFLSLGQFPSEGASYVLHQAPGASDLAAVTSRTVERIDGQLQRVSLTPLRQVVAGSLGDRRLVLWLTGAFAGLALLLTLIGMYGVVSFHVAQARRDIAIRMSLGATPPQILGRVLRMSARLAIAGCAIGIFGFWFLGRLIESQLYGIERHDAVTMVAVVVLLLTVAIVAALLPARRASRVAPMSALRES